MQNKFVQYIKKYFVVYICFFVFLFLSTYKLTESPPIWMDEGIISQVSRNVSDSGKYALQVAPNEFVSAGFVTTSYPVTLPVALSLKLFGSGLLQVRIVMVIFLTMLFFAVYKFLSSQFSDRSVFYSSLILFVTFAPIYGNGKNMLGEIPGLLFFIISLLYLDKIYKGENKKINFIIAGLSMGICVITKPIFILLGPALIFASILLFKKNSYKDIFILKFAFMIPVILWIFIQFTGDSISNIFSIYANPHSTAVSNSIIVNLKRFVTEAQPMYFASMFILWCISVFYRLYKKVKINIAEYISIIFALFVLLAYLRTIGYYRYFFLAQFVTILYLSNTILIFAKSNIQRKVSYVLIAILVSIQIYNTSFKSWVATHYNGTQTMQLSNAMSEIPENYHILVYQAPEAVIFLKSNNYSQYLEVTKTITIGYNSLKEIEGGTVPFIIINSEIYNKKLNSFSKYGVYRDAGAYLILKRN